MESMPEVAVKPIDTIPEFANPREYAREHRTCLAAPLGCGKAIKDVPFTDALSKREYEISFFCQECQDKIFGGDDE